MPDAIDSLYRQILSRGADAGGEAQFQNELAAGETLNDVRRELAYSPEAGNDIEGMYQQMLGQDVSPSDLSMYEGALADPNGGWTMTGVRANVAQSATAVSALNAVYQQMFGHPSNDPGLLAIYQYVMGTASIGWSIPYVRNDLSQRPEAVADISAIYSDLLGRAPGGAELVAQEGNLNAGMSVSTMRADIAGSPEAAAALNALYQTVLGRPVDAAGQQFYEGLMAGGNSLTGVRGILAGSPEAAGDISWMFTNELGRAATAGDLASWQGALASTTSLSGIRDAFAHTPDAAGFIQDAFQRGVGRAATPTELAGWQSYLGSGGSLNVMRTSVFYSPEAGNDIAALYQEVLGRAPGSAEITAEETLLAQGGSQLGLQQAAATSTEAGNDISWMFSNELGRAATPGDLAAWEGQLSIGVPLSQIRSAFAYSTTAMAVIQDTFQRGLGRAATATDVAGWQSYLSQGGTIAGMQAIVFYSPEAANDITAAYQQVLGRTPSAAEIGLQETGFAQGGSQAAMVQTAATSAEAADDIASAFSNELGRTATAGDIAAWVGQLAANVPLSQIRTAFAFSATATSFIQDAYQRGLGRTATASELTTWQSYLAAGGSISGVQHGVFYSDEESNALGALYQAVLGRPVDGAGQLNYENLLAGGESLADVRSALANSPEEAGDINTIYLQMLGQPASAAEIALYESALSSPTGNWSLTGVRWNVGVSSDATAAINGIYQQMMGHGADPGQLAVYEYNMGSGTIAWSLANVRADLAQSAEATTAITADYAQILNRSVDPASVAFQETQNLASGMSLADLRRNIADSQETTNELQGMYQQMLGQGASAADIATYEADLGNGWTISQVRADLGSSSEATAAINAVYQQMFGHASNDPGLLGTYEYLMGSPAYGWSVNYVRTDLASRPEAVADINAMYTQLLGRPDGAAELATQEQNLAAGMSLSTMQLDIAHSAEAQTDFDAAYYLAQNPDVAASGMDPYLHYIQVGWKEGRNPSAYFNTDFYLQQNPDVAAAGVNPLLHYRVTGWHEGRNPSASFDTSEYLATYQDVAAAGVDPLQHYVQFGQFEGRQEFAAPIDQNLANEATEITSFYYSVLARPATSVEIGNVEIAVEQGQTLAQAEAFLRQNFVSSGVEATVTSTPTPPPSSQDVATLTANALYQQVFGRNAFDGEISTIRNALAAGQTVQQINNFLTPLFVASDVEDGLLKATYKQVTGQDADADTIASAKADIGSGAWLTDIRYDFGHSDAAAAAVDETFRDVLGRSASDSELAIWEDELSTTGTQGSMRSDLAQHHTADQIDRMYREVLDRSATATDLIDKQGELTAGKTLGDIRSEVAHSSEAVSKIDATVLGETGLADDAPTLAEIEAGLAAGASLDNIVSGENAFLRLATVVSQDVSYDSQGSVNSFANVLDPFKVARDVAYSFYQTLLGRPPSQDEVIGLKAALSLDMAPSTKLIMLDHNGGVLGQARADSLLTQLPVFITLNGGITPGVQVPGGLALNDGAQVAAFLLAMEARAGRIDQKAIAIYNDVTSWLDQVGQQLLQLAATMAQSAAIDTNGDRRAIEAEVVKIALQLAGLAPSQRLQVASTSLVHRITLSGHQADVSLEIDQLTGQWTLKVHDIDKTNLFVVIVEAVVLIATVVLTLATYGATAELLALQASTITALQVVVVVGNVALAAQNFANGDVLGGLLSLAAAVGAGLIPAGPQGSQTALVSFAGSAKTGQLILAARGIIGGIAAAVQSAESGNAVGLASSLLSIAASAASGDVALQGNNASDALKNVGLFLTGVSTAAGIADAYNRGDVQGGLMASLNGLLTAYSIHSSIAQNEVYGGDLKAAVPESELYAINLSATRPAGVNFDPLDHADSSLFRNLAQQYDPTSQNFHSYEFKDLVGRVGENGLTVEKAYAELLKNAVPGAGYTGTAVRDGESTQARFAGFGGTVITRVESSTNSIFNVTAPDHILDSGFVQRQIIVEDGNLYIRTTGAGINSNPFLAFVNEEVARPAFFLSTENVRAGVGVPMRYLPSGSLGLQQ